MSDVRGGDDSAGDVKHGSLSSKNHVPIDGSVVSRGETLLTSFRPELGSLPHRPHRERQVLKHPGHCVEAKDPLEFVRTEQFSSHLIIRDLRDDHSSACNNQSL